MDINATQFLRQNITTAEHFGFQSYEMAKKHPDCVACGKKLENTITAQERKLDSLHGMLTSGAQLFCDGKLHGRTEPTFFYSVEQVPRSGDMAVVLQVFNVEKSIAEAVLIQTLRSMVNDLGFSDHTIRINSLGDRESSVRYLRELTTYLRKRMDDMPEAARELMKEHAYYALTHLIEKEHELAYRSPNPLEYLSDQSRKHFREIIEFLDLTSTPYEIDPKLIGHHECYTDALFAIDINDENGLPNKEAPIMIQGGRYNEFVHRTTKQMIPAAGGVIILKQKKAPARIPRVAATIPGVYVVQLGFGPKVRSLMLIETLRNAGIPVMQNLASDSLSAQLRDAEERGVRHTIIIGQKEYVDGTVILRDMQARNQEHVPLASVAQRLKRVAASVH